MCGMKTRCGRSNGVPRQNLPQPDRNQPRPTEFSHGPEQSRSRSPSSAKTAFFPSSSASCQKPIKVRGVSHSVGWPSGYPGAVNLQFTVCKFSKQHAALTCPLDFSRLNFFLFSVQHHAWNFHQFTIHCISAVRRACIASLCHANGNKKKVRFVLLCSAWLFAAVDKLLAAARYQANARRRAPASIERLPREINKTLLLAVAIPIRNG